MPKNPANPRLKATGIDKSTITIMGRNQNISASQIGIVYQFANPVASAGGVFRSRSMRTNSRTNWIVTNPVAMGIMTLAGYMGTPTFPPVCSPILTLWMASGIAEPCQQAEQENPAGRNQQLQNIRAAWIPVD